MSNIVQFILDIPILFRDIGANIIQFATTEIDLPPFGTVSVIGLICGTGLVGFLIFKVAIWLINS